MCREEPKIHQEKTEKLDEKIGNDLKESANEKELPVIIIVNVFYFFKTCRRIRGLVYIAVFVTAGYEEERHHQNGQYWFY